MSRQSEKAAKRSTKAVRRPLKKSVKTVAKSERSADKTASKSARNPVGKSPTKSTRSKSPHSAQAASMAAARATSKMVEKIMRTASPPVQPVSGHEIALKSHKYHVGEVVYFTSPTFGRAAATGTYTVVKLLPSESDDYQYRIKSSGEAFERVAKESQLEKI